MQNRMNKVKNAEKETVMVKYSNNNVQNEVYIHY